MSAFICSDKHISTIALNAIDFDRYKEFKNPVTGKPFTVQELADELKRLNINSVNYRYDESVPVSSCDLQEAVLLGHRIDPGDEHRLDMADLIRLTRSLRYQSCEDSDVDLSLIEEILDSFAYWISDGGAWVI